MHLKFAYRMQMTIQFPNDSLSHKHNTVNSIPIYRSNYLPTNSFPESHRKFRNAGLSQVHTVSSSRYVKVTLCQVHAVPRTHRPTKQSQNGSVIVWLNRSSATRSEKTMNCTKKSQARRATHSSLDQRSQQTWTNGDRDEMNIILCLVISPALS